MGATSRRLGQCAFALLLGAGLFANAGAQPGAPADPKPAERGTILPGPSSPGRVHLDVVVTDAAGKPVTGLKQQDFTLLEDGQPIKIQSFEAYDGAAAKPDPPVQAIVVIDAVSSDFTELNFMRQGLAQFFRQDGGKTALPISLLLFTVEGMKTLSPPTTDGNALANLVEKMSARVRPHGVFPFALSMPALARLAQDEKKIAGRKLLLWLGAGWETQPDDQEVMTAAAERNRQHYFETVVLLSSALREARMALYGGFAASPYFDRDFLKGVRKVTDVDPRNLRLSVLALNSGGRGDLPYVNRDSDLSGQLNGFLAEADTFYSLTFNPSPAQHADEYHDLKVELARPGLTARTNTGYYNQPGLNKQDEARPYAIPRLFDPAVNEFEGRPVTVAELEPLVRHAAGERDGNAAKELFRLRLTQRLSSPRLDALSALLPGAHAKAALTELADASVFLSLPAEDTPAEPAPDIAEQRRIVALAVRYLHDTIPRLPNFYATRTTQRFEDTSDAPGLANVSVAGGEPMHSVGISTETVIYRDHREVVDSTQSKKRAPYDGSLITHGTFGPILTASMVDAAHGQMRFSHWEQGGAGVQAVFEFRVPQDASHYEVAMRAPESMADYKDLAKPTAYHGEVAFDPATGAILRLALESDTAPDSAMLRADVMVEYGMVEIGGKNYVCPVRSVSLSQGVARGGGPSLGTGFTRINDVTFSNYHVFRAEMKVLSGDGNP